ncbi:MAG: hypothetical protein ABI980_12470 [Nitrospirota bacterium]
MITESDSIALQLEWERRPNPSSCTHRTTEIEISEAHTYLTGDIVCTICGAAVAKNIFDHLQADVLSQPRATSRSSYAEATSAAVMLPE